MYYPSDNSSSLVGWFRLGVGVTSSGGLVSAWADQSGNAHDLLQATGTNQPAYDGSAILTFDGIDNWMATAGFTWNQPATIAMLVNVVAHGVDDYYADGATGDKFGWWQSGATALTIYAGANGPVGTFTVGSYQVISALNAGASSSLKIDGTTTTGNAGVGNPGGFNLGRYAGNLNFGNIAVKEIILRNVDDATIRANDHAYLQTL